MSFIAGAFLKKRESSVITQLSNLTQQLVTKESLVIVQEPYGIMIAGKRAGESVAEQVVQAASRGIIAGRLFSKSTHEPSSLTSHDIQTIEQSNGKFLAQQFWGRYILATNNRAEQTISLFRDPQGLATVFIVEQEEAIFFASELPVLYDMLPVKPELDWQYFSSFLVGAHYLTTATPFKGVMELFPGSGITLSAKGIEAPFLFWNPAELEHKLPVDEAYENKLTDVFSHCVNAWSKNIPGVVAELSGGVDSSSVLMMLKDSLAPDQKSVACNFYHPDVASSDEREHAKKVASACQTRLEFLNMHDYLPFDAVITERFDKPTSLLLFRYNTYLKSYPDYEVMSGQGGDHLFMAPPAIDSIADYYLLNGFKGITKKIKEISAYYRMPMMQVVLQNIKAYAGYKLGCIEQQDVIPVVNWMNQSLKEQIRSDIFKLPFKKYFKNIPPAKRKHIDAIYQAVAFIDRGYVRAHSPALNPLLSQPLVELALAAPAYALYGDGIDRAPFRRGMYRLKKHDYIWRKSKGETSGILMLGFHKNFENLSQLLLHGRLAQEGLIDTELLHAHLQKIMHGKNDDLWTVINLISVELWFTTWNSSINKGSL